MQHEEEDELVVWLVFDCDQLVVSLVSFISLQNRWQSEWQMKQAQKRKNVINFWHPHRAPLNFKRQSKQQMTSVHRLKINYTLVLKGDFSSARILSLRRTHHDEWCWGKQQGKPFTFTIYRVLVLLHVCYNGELFNPQNDEADHPIRPIEILKRCVGMKDEAIPHEPIRMNP